MRRTHKLFVGAATLAMSWAIPNAHAQVDIEPPLPNVLLLVDTSGSMDYKIDGSKVACSQRDPSLTAEPIAIDSEKSRWTQLIEVLTGDVQNYSCYTQDRSSPAFLQEYSLGVAPSFEPYDKGYHVPYHRILSNGCTIGPGTVNSSDAFAWGTQPFTFHRWDDPGTTCNNFQQSSTGLLDSFQDRARFGLMTFDTLTDPGVGLQGSKAPDFLTGIEGTWSYFLNWDSQANCNANASCAKGRPAGCLTPPEPFEVGARNAAAPPWEGRLVPFGDPFAPSTQVLQTNERIQQVLLAMRPYGATPINGMMSDAKNFLLEDGSPDKTVGASSCNTTDGQGCFGPKDDGYIKGGCRPTYVILLTDGEPNLDLRPWCAQASTDPGAEGQCPYDRTSWELAQDLATNAGNPIRTFVVGFAVSSVELGGPDVVDCSAISSTTEFDPDGLCGNNMNPKLSACCSLAKIAWYGGTTNAYFANDVNGLRSALSDILSLIASGSTTRTLPVFASSASLSDSFAASYSFLSSFRPARGSMWSGVLERRRTVCEAEDVAGVTVRVPKDQDIDPNLGDRFHENVNVEDPSHPRRFYTTIRDVAGGGIWSKRSIRPNLGGTNPDGVTGIGGDQVTGNEQFPTQVPATAMNVVRAACNGEFPVGTDQACAERFMGWQIGAVPANPALPSRVGNKFGDIFRSTPVVVTAPNEQLRDESYLAFANAQALRPPMLYTATNDGQLHAFKISKNPKDADDTFDVKTKTNNELWSYMPPAVLPDIPSQYPHTHQLLLDGKAIVKDVVFHRDSTNAQAGTGEWNTVLVSSFGSARSGYYAIDITNPVPKEGDASSGPKLLWQLTTDDDGAPLFGNGGTPAITTLFFDPNGGDNPAEYAVAILPGGDSSGPSPGACPRSTNWASNVDASYGPRGQVRCYPATPARSVTIVRLDTGEIIRSFRRQGDPKGTLLDSKIVATQADDGSAIYAPLDSPMTGQPVVYPSTTGSVAHRAFIGDRDGAIWRINFSSADPSKWKIDLFFDAYPTVLGNDASSGQPIDTPPILSVDHLGNLVVMFSTGDQEAFTPTPSMRNYVWSIREGVSMDDYKSEALWYVPFTGGERVSGPMSLFSSVLYFSSFMPTGPSSLCSSGRSKIWGVDYIQSKDKDATTGKNIPSSGPIARLADDNGDYPENGIALDDETIVFGIGIRQKPSCFDDDTEYTDPWFGAHTPMKSVTGGGFELVVQTGTGGQSEGEAITRTESRELPSPPTLTRIDSWAAVIE